MLAHAGLPNAGQAAQDLTVAVLCDGANTTPGPLNSWDRQPFSMSAGAEPVPAVTVTRNNLIFADYQGVKGLYHDDGE